MPKPIDKPELIDKKALLEILCFGCTKDRGGICRNEQGRCAEYTIIKLIPTIEAEPVRHGRWIDAHFVSGEDFYRCSECGCYIEKTYFANDYNVQYCPNCGARMDGGADNA